MLLDEQAVYERCTKTVRVLFDEDENNVHH